MSDLDKPDPGPDALAQVSAALDRLSEIFEHGSGVSLGGNILVRRDEVIDLVAQLRTALPSAPQIMAEYELRGEPLLDEAEALAIQIEQDARQEAAELISRKSVVTAAQREADRIRKAAQRQADKTRAEADQYLDDRLVALERALGRSLAQVQMSRDKLAGDL